MKKTMQPGVLVEIDPNATEGEILSYDRECFYKVRVRDRELIVHEDDMRVVPVDEQQLARMKERGGNWAAYRNEALDSATCGHVIFLKVGKDCTFTRPPKQAPDGLYGTGWKYVFKGWVNLDLGVLQRPEPNASEHLQRG